MPYASADLVLRAVRELEDHGHPVAVLVVPALLRKARREGLNPVDDPVPFGGPDEASLLEAYYRLPRSPYHDRPYRAVWRVREANPEEKWQKPKYAGGSTHRMRTSVAGVQVFEQIKAAGTGDRWRLRPNAGSVLAGYENYQPVRLVDLALWYGRNQDMPDLAALVEWFRGEFAPDVGDLLGTIYLDDIPADYSAQPFVDQRLDETDFFETLGSLPEAVTVSGTLSELTERLEDSLRQDAFHLPEGLVAQVLAAWLAGDIVALVGQPGTGKTRFATLLASALSTELDLEDPLLLPVREDFDEGEFLGYERLDGTPQLRPFATQIVQAASPLEPRVVILEEFNLATVESYLSSVLIALQEPSRAIHLPGGIAGNLPVDALIIATCNSYRDEPETRMRVSSPTKRRAVVITMRNVLADTVEEAGGTESPGFDDLITDLTIERIVEEVRRINDRSASGQATTLDALRKAQLGPAAARSDLAEETRRRLAAVAKALLDTPEGRSWFTFGLLRDTALAVGMANRHETAELRALVSIVGSKLFHQIRGPITNAEALAAALSGLPGAGEIDDLVEQVRRGSTGEIVPLL
jgi:MoxR-like ATPase